MGDACSGVGGVRAKDGGVFGAEGVEDLRVDGEEVEDVADCRGGGVVAGEEEEFHLVDGDLFENGVDSGGVCAVGVFFQVGG